MERNYYKVYAEIQHTHWWYLARSEILESILKTYLDTDRNRKLLDLGCGPGQMRTMLSQFGELFSTDFSLTALEFCGDQSLDHLVLADGMELPLASRSMDIVCAFDVLEHFKDDAQCISEINRVLKPNGFLFLTVPAYQWLWGRQDIVSHHFRRYHAKQVEELLTEVNLQILKLTYFNTILFPPIALIRLAYRLINFTVGLQEASGSSDFSIPHSSLLNTLCWNLFRSEKKILRRQNFPFGVSILCVSQKP